MWNPPHHMLLLSIQTHIDQGLIAPPSLANDTIRWYHYNGPSMANTLGNVLHKPCVIYDAGARRTSILRHNLPTHATITHNKHQHHSQSDRNDILVDGYCRIDAYGCLCREIIFIYMIDENIGQRLRTGYICNKWDQTIKPKQTAPPPGYIEEWWHAEMVVIDHV